MSKGNPPNQNDSVPAMPTDRRNLAAWFLGKDKNNAEHLRGIERSTEIFCQDPQSWPMNGEFVEPQVCWVGLPVPLKRANLHFLVAGVPGTGKTISFRLLLQSIFSTKARQALPGSDRAIIYDPKQEFFPILRGMGVEASQIVILNPFDSRACAWDLCKDYRNAAEAFQLAKSIIPCPESHSQPFFPKAAMAVLTGAICCQMQRNQDNWDLADVILSCLDLDALESQLKAVHRNFYTQMALNVLGKGDTRNSVFAELTSHLFEYLPIAAAWQSSRKKGRVFSIQEFLKNANQVVLLGANQSYSQPLKVVNQLLIKRMSEIVIDHVADGQWEALNRTWLVLDELRELGEVKGLGDLINKGRSRGVCAVLGFQDYPGLKESFGENVAHEITATCAHKVFLRLGGESAEWASRLIGKSEVNETEFSLSSTSSFGMSSNEGDSATEGYTSGAMGTSYSSSRTRSTGSGFNIGLSSSVTSTTRKREFDALLPSEISHLPTFDEGGGLSGFVCQRLPDGVPIVRKLRFAKELLAGLERESDDPGFLPISNQEMELNFQ